MKKIILIGIALMLIVTVAQAMEQPQPYIIVGHIYDDKGEKAQNVEVTLLHIRTGEVQTFLTNEKGEYLLECLNFKKGYENNDTLNISCIYGSQEVIINTSFCGIQCPINKPPEIPVEPIIVGTVLVSVLGGAYYYIKRRKKKFITEEKQKGGDRRKNE